MTDIIVPDHVAFVRQNGNRLHSLTALREALFGMNDAEYAHHVNQSRNDFANWIENIFADKQLANKLRHTTDKYGAIRVLDEELAERIMARGVFKKNEEPIHLKEPPAAFLEAPKKETKTSPVQKQVSQRVTDSVIVHKRSDEVLPLHEQINHLDKHFAHMTKHHLHTTSHHPGGDAVMEETVKGKIIDFTLGLIVGLMLGFVLARSIGIF
ncbi:MAG TPA: hypothetical protein VK158_00595 [Acidobacteriota bacterium]|nr:hypothetical protein [Acidobacteriota bacterium]